MKKWIFKNRSLLLAIIFLVGSAVLAALSFYSHDKKIRSFYDNSDFLFLTAGVVISFLPSSDTSTGIGKKVICLCASWVGAFLIALYFLK